jgi:hypothetical protein
MPAKQAFQQPAQRVDAAAPRRALKAQREECCFGSAFGGSLQI